MLNYCFLTAFPLFLHSLPSASLISKSLNLLFGTQGRSRRLKPFFYKQEQGTEGLLYPGRPCRVLLSFNYTKCYSITVVTSARSSPVLPQPITKLHGPPSFYLFIYLFMAVLGLRFCARAFSSCGERGPLFIAVPGDRKSVV